ncbi:MAG: sulfate ABC transporter substrate-binding protein [Aquabacterium sp.]|uniref:sulfate ABC transporter substrate-binding protein n=1 Tax=Aquabacterium sp. TaxID=1872578 RepID=UPI0012148CE8|nr:sulfate ABC transporter substrate-binding protein [Aquabacterium sp.]TAK91316.1 MAG: sulfate ABC transporter substrate-binding protein [Aquabacterium sp.]
MSFKFANRRTFNSLALAALTAVAGVASLVPAVAQAKEVTLLNVSYDPTRELYQEYNAAFAKYWKAKTGDDVSVKASHGGSGKQARSVIDGLEADVVTLALAYDIDAIADKGLLSTDWQKKFKFNSTPYSSTIVFLVRKGNPKNIKTWDDVVKPGNAVITANPKTSGGARWAYLAAYGYALKKNNGDDAKARDFIKKLFEHVPVLDSGARGATVSFSERGLGDVLLSWESEVGLIKKEFGDDKFDVIYPSVSILAEPPVAVVDKVVDKRGTRDVAQAYLEYLYSPAGQDLIGKNYYRPTDPKAAAKYAKQFPKLNLFTVDDTFGGWTKAQKTHFADGGVFDQIYTKK